MTAIVQFGLSIMGAGLLLLGLFLWSTTSGMPAEIESSFMQTTPAAVVEYRSSFRTDGTLLFADAGSSVPVPYVGYVDGGGAYHTKYLVFDYQTVCMPASCAATLATSRGLPVRVEGLEEQEHVRVSFLEALP